MFIFMNTVHERLRHLRENVKGLPLREFRARINAELADEEQLSLGTISNYERPADGARRAAPRARARQEPCLPWLHNARDQERRKK